MTTIIPDAIIIPNKDGTETIITANGASTISLHTAELVPVQRAQLTPYSPPQPYVPTIYLKDEIIESLQDGRALIYIGSGLCLALAGITGYLFLLNLIDALHIISLLATTVLSILFVGALISWACRTKPTTEVTLRGCPSSGGPLSYNFSVDKLTGALHLKD